MGELFTIWSVRLAVASYFGRYLVDAAQSPGEQHKRRWSRCLWTAGCLFYLGHVVGAFAFFHHWSHQAAYAHTAAQTREVIGWNWGGGLYFNYLFTLLWTVDVVRQWIGGASKERISAAVSWTLQLFMAFIVINATALFGPPLWKWVAAVFAMLLAALWYRRRSRPGADPDSA